MVSEDQVLQNTEETQPTQTHFSFGTELPGTENRELGESLTNVLSHLTPPTSSAASPHIHAVVCNSQTCTRNSIINTSHHMGHSQPTSNNQPNVPQSTQNLFDRDTSPLASREELIPQNSNQPAREDDDPQIINMLQQMSQTLITLRSDNRCLKEDIACLWDRVLHTPQSPKETHHHRNPPSPPHNYIPNPPIQNNRPSDLPMISPVREINQSFGSSQDPIATRLRQEKAFKQLINTTTTKFNGKDVLEYAPWKTALSIETENLHLTSTQFLKLLEARTELEPNQIIKDLRYVQIEMGPDSALQMAWEILNKTYHSSQSPSQQLLKKLTQGPQIKSTDTSALVSFSTQCHAALSLHLSNRHAIPSLQEQGTLDSIVNRLDITLRREWFTHRMTLGARREEPTFDDFASWISRQTHIARFERNLRPSLTTANPSEGLSKPTNNKDTPTTPYQNQQIPNKRSNQKINPGGDKEYRDYLRSSRSNSPQGKNLPKSRDMSPQIHNQPNRNPINTNLPKYPRGGDC